MAPSGTVSSGTDYTFSGKEKQRFGAVHDFGARMYDPRNAIWNAIDPKAEKYYSVTPHAYCNNNPVIFVDPGGEAIETAWDVMNVVSDAVSLVSNVANGNTVGAIVDAGALVIDAVAAVVPFLPGGVGAVVNAARNGDKVADAAGLVSKPSLSKVKEAVITAKEKIGLKPTEALPKGEGRFGSPTRGDSIKGYRLDPGHTDNGVESRPHINYWDYSKGKRKNGGISGSVEI